ncbi:MAG: HD domain-containing protein, partial [Acidimicrobiales bacterium]
GVARRVAAALGAGADRAVLAAALLHDVGKVEAGLGTLGRVAATVAGALGGRARARSWSRGRGVRRRVGCYLRHAEVGAELLGAAGSDPLTVAWTRQHHLPPPRWSVPPVVGRALKGADDG